MTSLDMYQLAGLNMSSRLMHFLELANDVHLDQIYLGFYAGSTSVNVLSLLDDFSGGPQDTLEDRLLMAQAFLMCLLGSTNVCNSSQTVAVKWLYCFEDLERTVGYN